MTTIGSGIGSAAGSRAAGWIFDLSGSYRLAFIMAIADMLAVVTLAPLKGPAVNRHVRHGPFSSPLPRITGERAG